MITKYPKWSQNIPNGHKISQTITKYPKSSQNIPNGHTISQISVTNSKWPQNISSFSRLRPSKFSPNLEFWFEKRPSGNPGEEGCQHFTWFTNLSFWSRVARWYIFKPKITNLVLLKRPWYGKLWHISPPFGMIWCMLWPFSIFCDRVEHFFRFGIF
jgi:hypothetical protein